jgi:hypothetical protein
MLSESVPIVEGQAFANLELFNGIYYYEVIIDGITYVNTDSFSQCLPLSTTEYSFLVDILQVPETLPSLGFLNIDCSLSQSGDVYSLVWGNNPNSDLDITGCLVKYKQSVLGNNINQTVCTNVGNILVREMNSDSDNYFISGQVYQGNNSKECGLIEVNPRTNGFGIFGMGSLFAVIILFLFLILVFSGNPQIQIIALIFGIIITMWIGLTAFGWIETSLIVALLVLGLFVGRYSKK